MPKYEGDTIPVCVACDKKDELNSCMKCHVEYCKHYASAVNVRFCANCIGDLKLKETIIEKVVEHERADGTVTFSRKYQARRLVLTGNDWIFISHLIADMPDAEIEAAVEYHRANVDILLQEREGRKQERYRKLAGIKIIHKPGESQEQRERREARASGKKTKVKEKDPAQALVEALTQLAKAGLTVEQITAMMGVKK